MRWHIILSFIGVDKLGIAFRDQIIDKSFKILPHRWICIFIDGQSCRSMQNENLKDPNVDISEFRKFPLNDVCYQMESPWKGFKIDLFLKTFHLILQTKLDTSLQA